MESSPLKISAAHWFARVGYLCVAILLLQIISLATISLVEFTILGYDDASPNIQPAGKTGLVVDHVLAPFPDRPEEASLLADLLVWSALIVVSALLLIYTARIISALMKRVLARLFKKVTASNLFAMKFILIGLCFTLLALFPFLLPAAELLTSINALLALFAYVGFGVQFYLVRLNKTPAKNIL